MQATSMKRHDAWGLGWVQILAFEEVPPERGTFFRFWTYHDMTGLGFHK